MEDETQSAQKTSPLFAAAAILGLGVGAIAAAIGAVALKKISAATDDINARIEKNAAVELEIKKISDRVDSLALQIENIKSSQSGGVKQLADEVQKVVDVLNSNINEIRGEVVKNREAIEKVASAKPAAEAKRKDAAKEQPDADAKAASGKVHKIQSGDTLAKLAKKYSVSVSALQKANPDVNPARLKIGQEIQIP